MVNRKRRRGGSGHRHHPHPLKTLRWASYSIFSLCSCNPLLMNHILITSIKLSPLVQFLLVRHPDETTLEPLLKDSIQMSGDAPVSVLQSFLCKKLSCGSPASDFEILIRMEGTCVVLNPTLHLGNVKREFCSTLDETMVLYYRLK